MLYIADIEHYVNNCLTGLIGGHPMKDYIQKQNVQRKGHLERAHIPVGYWLGALLSHMCSALGTIVTV